MKKKSFLLVALGAVLAVAVLAPAAALAQDQLANPSASQYEPQQGVQGISGGGGSTGSPGVAATPSSGGGGGQLGSLPFTGMDLVIVAGVALLLTGSGLALHRLSVNPRSRG
jgi:hypothetical protein